MTSIAVLRTAPAIAFATLVLATPVSAKPIEEEPAQLSILAPIEAKIDSIKTALLDGARAAGMDLAHFRAMASIESDLDPSSNWNKRTQYKGLFQIGREEWANHGHGNIYNAHDNAMAMASLVNEHRAQFMTMFGRNPTDDELYLVHQQGMGFYTHGTMTNVHGNPYPGMRGRQTTGLFEAGWAREVERRANLFGQALFGMLDGIRNAILPQYPYPGYGYTRRPSGGSWHAYRHRGLGRHAHARYPHRRASYGHRRG